MRELYNLSSKNLNQFYIYLDVNGARDCRGKIPTLEKNWRGVIWENLLGGNPPRPPITP